MQIISITTTSTTNNNKRIKKRSKWHCATTFIRTLNLDTYVTDVGYILFMNSHDTFEFELRMKNVSNLFRIFVKLRLLESAGEDKTVLIPVYDINAGR